MHGISSEHLVGYGQPLKSILKLLFDTERKCVENADKIICVSKKTMEDAREYYDIKKNKCVYVPNGVDTKIFHKKQRGKTNIIGFVGYVHEHKGLHFLLGAMKRVINEINDASLMVVGNGNIKKFKDMSRKLGIEKNVKFLGPVSRNDILKLYRSFDVFAMPSQYEGFGIAALEAIATGVPIVVSNTGQLNELAKGTGFVVDPRDTGQLAGGILKILKDDNLHERLSKNCQKKAKHYEWDRVVEKTIEVYRETIKIKK